MKNSKPLKNKKLILIIFLLLILITLLTKFYGSEDVGDYATTSKFFAGLSHAKARNSHSYLFGFLHFPFVSLFKNFLIFKITSLIFLMLIILSVYKISGKDEKVLWLILLCPILWYMAPWINPIQLASLLFLWAYYFIKKYNDTNNIKNLICSAIFIGLGWAVWDTIFYFGFILAFVFLFNKKFSHLLVFLFFLLIGLMPRLILDQFLFNFPFFSIMKSMFGGFANTFGGIYQETWKHAALFNIQEKFIFILAIPLYYWMLYKPKFFKENKKSMIFLSLCLILLFTIPQIRYVFALAPIMILLIAENINKKQFKKQIIFSIILLFLFISPYIIQINYSLSKTEEKGIQEIFMDFSNLQLDNEFLEQELNKDLEKITKDYPNQVFVVGNAPDDYRRLAKVYWKDNVKEFVSIQDYNLVLNNQTILYEKTFIPVPNINSRRQIWIAGGMNKNENDDTDYENISLGIGFKEPINLEGFKLIKKKLILIFCKI